MNRRQFLGRVFQSIISMHNAENLKYIYHPWRQYEIDEMKSNVTMNLKMRVGDNPYYDSSVTDKNDSRYGKYRYSNIPYTSSNGPIMAIYDKDEKMIYCSAYYYNNYLYNNISSSGTTIGKLPSGTYTLKCLSLGKGLYLGESGEAITFEVPTADRRYDSEGAYNPKNNYGYIDRPTVNVDFLFDYEGLSFDLDVKIVSVGNDIRNVEGVKHAIYKYPTYEEMKAEAATYGYNVSYDGYMTQCGYYSNSGAVPYEYLIKYSDIRREYRYVNVYEHKGYDNKTLRGKVDVTGCKLNTNTAVGFEKAFKENGLDFDASINMVPYYNTELGLYNADRMDGSIRDYYYYYQDEMSLYNEHPINNASRYPATSLGAMYVNVNVTSPISTGISYSRITAYKEKQDEEHYNAKTKIYTSIPLLNFDGKLERYSFYVPSGKKREWFDNPMNGNKAGENNTPAENIRVRVQYFLDNLKPRAQAALDKAISNYGKDVNDYHFKKIVDNTSYSIPLDIIFGKYSGNYPVIHSAGTYSEGATYTPKYNSDGELSGLYIDLNYNDAIHGVQNVDMHKSANGSIDITGYDFCTDYSTGWYYNLVLRQEIVHLNIEEVPDHQIRPK